MRETDYVIQEERLTAAEIMRFPEKEQYKKLYQ